MTDLSRRRILRLSAGAAAIIAIPSVAITERVQTISCDVVTCDAAASVAPYPNRATAEAATVPAPVTRIGVKAPNGDTLFYKGDLSGTALTTAGGRNWSPDGEAYPDHWAENTIPKATNLSSAIQAAMDYVASLGGGKLHFYPVGYAIDTAIFHKRGVYLQGSGWFFNSDYTTFANFQGSHIYMLTGSNSDGLIVRADISDLDGFPRQHGGARDIAFYGNKSDSISRTATDLNSTGNGVRIQGASYFTMDNVLAYRWAGTGVSCGSFDYGDGNGLRGCNNMNWRNVTAIQNAGGGFAAFAGDSTISQLVAGYNGGAGYSGTATPLVGCLAWNNEGTGISQSGAGAVVGCEAYDNGGAGVSFFNTSESVLDGCSIYANGKLAGGITTTCGVYVLSGVDRLTVSGCWIGNDEGASPQQQTGIYSTSGTANLILGGNSITGNATANITWAGPIDLHGASGSFATRHPGFTATDAIVMDGQKIERAGFLSYDVWGNINSISSGAIIVESNSTYSLDVVGGGTITDMTYSGTGLPRVVFRNINASTVTFAHNSAKLRLNGAVNAVLATNESIEFIYVSGAVWQQVGGKVGP